MIVINVIFLLLLIGYYAFTLIRSREVWKEIDRQEHRLYLIYPMAEDFLNRTGLYRLLQRKRDITARMKALYVTNKPEAVQKLYWYKKVSSIFLLILTFTLFSLIYELQAAGHMILQDGRYLIRPEQGEGSYVAELSVDLKQSPGIGKKGTSLSKEVDITVEERAYTDDEVGTMLETSIIYLKKAVLGKNQSADQLREPLNLITKIPDNGVMVEWQSEDYTLIHSDGTLGNEALTKPTPAAVTATLSCQKQRKDLRLDFIILPAEKRTDNTDLTERLENEVQKAAGKASDQKRLELPAEWGQYLLYWDDRKNNSGLQILLFGIGAAILLWRLMDQELERKMKLRKEQMLSDYPEIINKFTLLVNAGMTIRQAWFRITEDYNMSRDSGAARGLLSKRYAYEEMLATANELRLGVAEAAAYEQYGRRTGLIPYIKFGSLITQNLRKGNKGFTELLKQEAFEAFEERKEAAKRQGEEAGTKLLMPMMLMLLIVFMIILIPAFLSFQIQPM